MVEPSRLLPLTLPLLPLPPVRGEELFTARSLAPLAERGLG